MSFGIHIAYVVDVIIDKYERIMIMSNIQANAMNQVKRHDALKSQSAARISSGKQINRASEGAAELAVSAKLSAGVRAIGAATSNASRSLSFGQIADASLEILGDQLARIKELAVNASSDTLDAADRAAAQQEVTARLQTMSDIVDTTRFGDTVLLNASGGAASDGVFQFQTGEKAGDTSTLTLSTAFDTTTLGVDVADISTFAGAQTAIGLVDTAIASINTGRATVGAFMANMESVVDANTSKSENTSGALSVLMDADIAKEATALALADIASQLAQNMVSKENQSAANVVNVVR